MTCEGGFRPILARIYARLVTLVPPQLMSQVTCQGMTPSTNPAERHPGANKQARKCTTETLGDSGAGLRLAGLHAGDLASCPSLLFCFFPRPRLPDVATTHDEARSEENQPPNEVSMMTIMNLENVMSGDPSPFPPCCPSPPKAQTRL